MRIKFSLITLLLISAIPAMAADKVVTVNSISDEGVGESIGTVKFADSKKGLMIKPDLAGLTPGNHGLHIHQNPSCEPAEKDGKPTAGEAAGEHFDPAMTDKHKGPVEKGHKGDLPVLKVAANGKAKTAMIATRLKLADIVGRSIMIHEGGDNYSDKPEPAGGGGAKVACGVIE